MPFSDQTEYPRGVFHTSVLSDTALPVVLTGVKVSHISMKGGAAAEIIIFRRPSAGAEYFRKSLAIGEVREIARGFFFADGLEVICASAAGDVELTIFYFSD